MTRGALKAGVARDLSATTVVIADSMNYIKGFRYELYVPKAQYNSMLVCDLPAHAGPLQVPLVN